jgi:hypothetical protein
MLTLDLFETCQGLCGQATSVDFRPFSDLSRSEQVF